MDIETSSAIKLFFPNPSLLLVFYEAIANSLDAGATKIDITVSIHSFKKAETLNVKIIDNGTGFNNESFERFKTLLKPKDGDHKGIGRLVFLNYFKKVEIISEWENKRRSFVFKNNFDGSSTLETTTGKSSGYTELDFKGFYKDRIKSYEDIKPGSLKEKIIFHFLPTLNDLRDKDVDFNISISLKTDDQNSQKEFFSSNESITKEDLPVMRLKEIQEATVDFVSSIKMHYDVKKSNSSSNILTAINVDGRTIPISLLQSSKIPVGHAAVFIFSSEMFSAGSDSSRQRLDLSDKISESALYSLLRREIGNVLAEQIPQISRTNQETTKKFEEQFPHLLGYFDETTVGLIDREEALNSAQQKFFKLQKEILQCDHLSDSLYKKSLEASARTLTEYILYREKIIDKLKAITSGNSEEEIHNLIVPRRQDFQQGTIAEDAYQNNAWLLDDKFMTFRTVLSEARMDKVISEITLPEEQELDEPGRPDIAMIFSADPNDNIPVDVVIVEIKKKTDSEKENQYAINQLLSRARKLTNFCPNIQRIWYYAVLEINDDFEISLRQQNWAPLFSKGRVLYQEFQTPRKNGTNVPTPIFALSFDAIVSDAKSRNHTFLEILRSAMKRHSQPIS